MVEDDDIAYDSISRHLLSASYTPIRARHGDEALRLAKAVRPDAITLDLVLPGLDGWDVLKRLKADRTTIVIAHRLSTVRDANLIVVLGEGRVMETGNHATLLAKNGIYASLVSRQLASARVI